jgi:hypothetical protein
MIGILGLNHGKLGGMRPGFIMCLWSDEGRIRIKKICGVFTIQTSIDYKVRCIFKVLKKELIKPKEISNKYK